MPTKNRELIADLQREDFRNRGGHGSHRNFKHPLVSKPVGVPGRLGDDAKDYVIKQVRRAIQEVQDARQRSLRENR